MTDGNYMEGGLASKGKKKGPNSRVPQVRFGLENFLISEVLVTVRLAHFELGKPVLRSSDACVHKRVPSDAFHFVLQLILVR